MRPTSPVRYYPLARLMFWLAFTFLLVIAGVLHRGNQLQATRPEIIVMAIGLGILWPLITIETWIAFFIRDRSVRPRSSTLARSIWITFLPPLRMGMPCPFTGRMWLPGWGWCDRGPTLEGRLERTFHVPMLVFALPILPVLVLEFVSAKQVRENPALALALHVGVSAIWVAFAIEFVVKVSAARRPLAYAKARWLDLVIVVLPMLEFALSVLADAALLARLLRISRAAAPEQLARMGQLYRLRGLLIKGWRAVLVLRLVARLTGDSAVKRLRKLENVIAEAEEELAKLRQQADELRLQLIASRLTAEQLGSDGERESRTTVVRGPTVFP
jgi:hypothetical protein